MNKELKPCPFCGGEAETEGQRNYMGNDFRSIVICRKCGAQIRRDGTVSVADLVYKQAIEAWNTRKPMDRIVEQLEGLPNVNSDYWNSSDLIDREDAIEIVKGGGRHDD